MTGCIRAAGILIVGLTATGCNEAEQPAEKIVATQRSTALPKWITVKDKIEPAVWLQSREVGHVVSMTDPQVDRIRRALNQATVRFYEDSRMIANRTAQTGEMLAAASQPEHFVDIVTGMVDVADVTPHKKLYGEMCQHYLNIRTKGASRSESIATLMKSYKDKTSSK